MTSLLIIEDEPPAARRLLRLAETAVPEANVFAVQSLPQAMAHLSKQSADIICLDLNLAGEDGFKVLAHENAKQAAVVVISAHLERAVEGFEHGVVDFVPKPVSATRFAMALDRAQEALRQDAKTEGRGARLAVRRPGGVDLVPLAQILSISGAGDYAEICTINGRTYLDDRTLGELEELLSGHLLRVHRSYLVNVNFIRKLTKNASQTVVELEGGTQFPVARRAVAKVTAELPKLSS